MRAWIGLATVWLAVGCGRVGFDADPIDVGTDAAADAYPTVSERQFGDGPNADVSGATIDTSVLSGSPDENCGACNNLYGGGGESGLLRFDLTSLDADTTIVDASVEVWLNSLHTLGGSVDIYVVREAWDEGDQESQDVGVANWTERQPGVPWTGEGVGPGSRDDMPFQTSEPASLEAPLVVTLPPNVVQAWVADPSTNHGIVFQGRDYPGEGGDHPHFVSSENAAQPERRPVLVLRFR